MQFEFLNAPPKLNKNHCNAGVESCKILHKKEILFGFEYFEKKTYSGLYHQHNILSLTNTQYDHVGSRRATFPWNYPTLWLNRDDPALALKESFCKNSEHNLFSDASVIFKGRTLMWFLFSEKLCYEYGYELDAQTAVDGYLLWYVRRTFELRGMLLVQIGQCCKSYKCNINMIDA